MRIRKYDFDYGRRALMEKIVKGSATAGVLTPLWPLVGNAADIGKAYPDELMSIEMQTKGKIKTGDMLTAGNVEHAKHLLDPIVFEQVKSHGRKIKIKATTRDVSEMYPAPFLEGTLKSQGTAKFGDDGNVYGADGKPFKGGQPFPAPKTAVEAMTNLAMSWGKGDNRQYAILETDVGPNGKNSYNYTFCWVELQVNNRTDGTVFQGRDDLLRHQLVLFTSSQDVAGSSFLSTWYYDQRKFPDLYGYLPQFKRVRQFPTNQRFEPLIPGVTWFLSDPWAAGDPVQTWGNFRTVERKPMLGGFSGNWAGQQKNWEKPLHGGAEGVTFMDTEYELAPEVLVLDMDPTSYSRAPCSKRRVYVDVRNSMYCGNIRYDRQGNPWVNFEMGSGQFVDGDKAVYEPGTTSPAWSWTYVMAHDIQNNRMSRGEHCEEITGGYKTRFDRSSEELYDTFCTQQALQRLGSV
tara:strand:- start:7643 stop:9025 length:1383 start_codon:yes stop_codon:yes gene_type:complete